MRKLLLLIIPVSISAALAVYGLFWLDNIVHGTLYDYGLQFSYEWANPYWSVLRTVQALIGLTAVFSVVSYLYMYRTYTLVKRRKHEKTIAKTEVDVETEHEKRVVSLPPSPTPTFTPIPSTRELEPEPVSVSGKAERADGLVRCNHCNRVFSQPLRMLDFHAERPRIISICPFCNEVVQPAIRKAEAETVKKHAFWKLKKNNNKEQGEATQKEEAKNVEEKAEAAV
jgi:hypothetical protein